MLFDKGYFGAYHGSLSVRLDKDTFLINKKQANFYDTTQKNFTRLHLVEDYGWRDASIDSSIHRNIYGNISNAKFILYCMPPFATAYALTHAEFVPQDFFGFREIKCLKLLDTGDYNTWYGRAKSEIARWFIDTRTNLLLIRRYGVYAYARDLKTLVSTVDILEYSCRNIIISGLPYAPNLNKIP